MLHSRFNRIMAIVFWAVAALVAGIGLWGAEPSLAVGVSRRRRWPPSSRGPRSGDPAWVVDDGGVHVRNVTHSVDIPWEALIHLDTKHALTLFTPGGRFTVWSAPAPGIMTLAAHRAGATLNREASAVGSAPAYGRPAGSDSGDAAMLVRDEWQRRVDAGRRTPAWRTTYRDAPVDARSSV